MLNLKYNGVSCLLVVGDVMFMQDCKKRVDVKLNGRGDSDDPCGTTTKDPA